MQHPQERKQLTEDELRSVSEDYVDRQLATMQRHGALRKPLSPEQRQTVVQKVMAATAG